MCKVWSRWEECVYLIQLFIWLPHRGPCRLLEGSSLAGCMEPGKDVLFKVQASPTNSEISISRVKTGPGLPASAAIATAANMVGVPPGWRICFGCSIKHFIATEDGIAQLAQLISKFLHVRFAKGLDEHARWIAASITCSLTVCALKYPDYLTAFTNICVLQLIKSESIKELPTLPPSLTELYLDSVFPLFDISGIEGAIRLRRITLKRLHSLIHTTIPAMPTVLQCTIEHMNVSQRMLAHLATNASDVVITDVEVAETPVTEHVMPVFTRQLCILKAPGIIVTADRVPHGVVHLFTKHGVQVNGRRVTLDDTRNMIRSHTVDGSARLIPRIVKADLVHIESDLAKAVTSTLSVHIDTKMPWRHVYLSLPVTLTAELTVVPSASHLQLETLVEHATAQVRIARSMMHRQVRFQPSVVV